MSTLRIGLFGTSLTAHGGWADDLRLRLAAYFPQLSVEVMNYGILGATSAMILQAIQVGTYDLSIAMLEPCMNDAFQGLNPDTVLRPNVTAMAAELRDQCPGIKVIGHTTNNVRVDDYMKRDHVWQLYAEMEFLTDSQDFYILDDCFRGHEYWQRVITLTSGPYQTFLPDLIHPCAPAWVKFISPRMAWFLSKIAQNAIDDGSLRLI